MNYMLLQSYSIPNQFGPVFFGTIIGMVIMIVLLSIYLKNLQDLLQYVREENRSMQPKAVWLLLAGCIFNILLKMVWSYIVPDISYYWLLNVLSFAIVGFIVVWHLVIVTKVSASIQNEFESRNIDIAYKPTYSIGITMCICQAVSSLLNMVPYLRIFIILAALGGFIFWIIYWVKTSDYKKKLRTLPAIDEEDSLIFKDLY